MTQGVSLKLNETVYEATNRLRKSLGLSRNAYITKAILYYNRLHERRSLAQRLREESRLVRHESKAVLEEFERLPENEL